jgi:hypothetical protein
VIDNGNINEDSLKDAMMMNDVPGWIIEILYFVDPTVE